MKTLALLCFNVAVGLATSQAEYILAQKSEPCCYPLKYNATVMTHLASAQTITQIENLILDTESRVNMDYDQKRSSMVINATMFWPKLEKVRAHIIVLGNVSYSIDDAAKTCYTDQATWVRQCLPKNATQTGPPVVFGNAISRQYSYNKTFDSRTVVYLRDTCVPVLSIDQYPAKRNQEYHVEMTTYRNFALTVDEATFQLPPFCKKGGSPKRVNKVVDLMLKEHARRMNNVIF